MTKYRARVIHDPLRGWQKLDRVSIGVSMNNPGTDGEKFGAMIQFVNEQSNFRTCLICVSDTLSAWNETDETGAILPDAVDRARRKGDEWLVRNLQAINRLAIPYEIVRWDRWRNHPGFVDTLARTYALYGNSASFREAVNGDVEEVVQRRANDMTAERIAVLRDNSLNFFLEEIAGYSLFYQAYPNSAKMYPGGQIRSFMVEDTPEELKGEYFMQVHLKRLRQSVNPSYPSSVCFDSSQAA